MVGENPWSTAGTTTWSWWASPGRNSRAISTTKLCRWRMTACGMCGLACVGAHRPGSGTGWTRKRSMKPTGEKASPARRMMASVLSWVWKAAPGLPGATRTAARKPIPSATKILSFSHSGTIRQSDGMGNTNKTLQNQAGKHEVVPSGYNVPELIFCIC